MVTLCLAELSFDAVDPVSVKCYSASFETFSPANLTSDSFTSLSDSSKFVVICGVRHLDPTVFMCVLHFNIETNSVVSFPYANLNSFDH